MPKSLKKIFAAAAMFGVVTTANVAAADSNVNVDAQSDITSVAQEILPTDNMPLQYLPEHQKNVIEPVQVLPGEDPEAIIAQNIQDTTSPQGQKPLAQQLAELAEIMGYIDQNAYAEVDDAELFTAALEAMQRRIDQANADGVTLSDDDYVQIMGEAIGEMLQTLDPHSSYFPPVDREAMEERTRGEFGGIGIGISYDDVRKAIKVEGVMEDNPAEEAGIQTGDLITGVDGESLENMTSDEALEAIRGAPNTDVVLTIERAGEATPLEITVTRAVIEQSAVTSRQIGDDIGYIRLREFSGNSARDLIEAVEELKTAMGSDVEGYVLDLRFNPGGLLDQGAEIVDAFLDDGVIVETRSRHRITTMRAELGDVTDGKPLVILVNSGSASASELVAEALQDHDRATVIGTTSHGKGSMQVVIPLSRIFAGRADGMKVTTALFYSPDGDTVQGRGVIPDIEVELSPEREDIDASIPYERTLPGYIENPGGTDHEPSPQISTLSSTFNENSVSDDFKYQDGSVDRALLTAAEFLRGTSEHMDIQDRPEEDDAEAQVAPVRGPQLQP